jgi:RNA 3'-terminal phosphate cyclase (ATP)
LTDKRGTADAVGVSAAEELVRTLQCGACVDEHTQDQLIVFLALAAGLSQLLIGPPTSHTRTAIAIAEVLTSAKFTLRPAKSCAAIEGEGGLWLLECEGGAVVAGGGQS